MTRTLGLRALAGALLASTALAGTASAQNYLWTGWDFSFEGGPSFIHGSPRHTFSQDLTGVLPNTLIPTNRRIEPGFGGNLRLFGSYRWGEMDVGLGYRSVFSGTNHEQSDLSLNPPNNATLPVYPGVINFLGFPVPIAGLTAKAQARSNMHNVDVEMGWNFRTEWGEWRLFGGARYAYHNSLVRTQFLNNGLAEFDVRRTQQFSGVGPRLGVSGTFPLSENWWFNAGFSGSVLFGNRRSSETRSLALNAVGVNLEDSTKVSGFHTVYSLDAELSLTHFFGGGWYGTLGYGAQSYLGLNDVRRLDPFSSIVALSPRYTGTGAGAIINHGPFVRVGWRPLHGPTGVSGGPALPIKGTIGVETRLYTQAPLYQGQAPQDYFSFWGELDITLDLADKSKIVLKPFFRYDQVDSKRTHWDLREAFWQKDFESFRLRAGVGRVFWGAVESFHVVDIINQVDQVENVDQEDRLGQPMVQLSVPRSWGTVDLFYLPYSRERTLPGINGRLRTGVLPDTGATQWEGGLSHWYPTFAARYSHTMGGLDFGVHFFHGLSREPSFKTISFQLNFLPLPAARVIPFYQIITQGGVDAVYTLDQWQFKFEGFVRGGFNNFLGREETYGAMAGGVEYTFRRFFDTGIDVGVLGEFLYDTRGRRATTPFENDLFLGLRFRFNDKDDTRVLLGYIQDVRDSDKSFFVEASRRLGDRWKVDVEARFIANPSADRILYAFRRDNHFRLRLSYRF